MEFSEQVLVLQVGRFKEADLWIRFLSPTRGLLSAFAFGGSRSRRRFIGCLDIFNHVLFRVKSTQRGAYLALQEGVLIRGLSRLRSDWQRLGMANNCVKFLQAFGVGPEGAAAAHRLAAETLQLLEEADTVPALLPFFFRARLAFDQGYAVHTRQCSACGNALSPGRGAGFLVREGRLVCSACARRQEGYQIFLPGDALAALDRIRREPPCTWKFPELSGTSRTACSRAIDGFIQYHVGLNWENGRFARV